MLADFWPTGKNKQIKNQPNNSEVIRRASDISKEHAESSSNSRNSSVNSECEPWVLYPAKLFIKYKAIEKLF